MPTPTPLLIWSSALPSDPLTLYNTHNSKRLMTPTIFRQASDIETRNRVWVSNALSADPTIQGQGYSAAEWAGVWADLYHEEAIARLPIFWDDED